MGLKNRKMHWYETVSSALNFPFLNEAPQNCFVFDIGQFDFRRKSRRIAAFLMLLSQLPPAKLKEVLQKSLVFQLPTAKFQRSLAE